MTPTVLTQAATLFEPRKAVQWGESPINGGNAGHMTYNAQSPQYGADIWYRLTQAAGGPVRVVIQDAAGDTLRTLNGPGGAGLHRVSWDFRGRPAARAALFTISVSCAR